jgi:hypothetical protein
MEKRELSIAEILKALNAEGFNARQKKSAAKFVVQFNGYESARANEGTEWEGLSVIIIETTGKYRDNIALVWDGKKWVSHGYRYLEAYYTPNNVAKASARREARNYEDKLVYETRKDEFVNRTVRSFYFKKSNELEKEARKLKDLVRELENKASEYRRKTY